MDPNNRLATTLGFDDWIGMERQPHALGFCWSWPFWLFKRTCFQGTEKNEKVLIRRMVIFEGVGLSASGERR